MKMIEKISVFFPAYNEEKNVERTVNKAEAVLRKIADTYEIIIVNDGSGDKTGVIAEALAKKDDRIRVIHHPKNLGYGGALKTGWYSARYPWIACVDIDGQFDFAEITKLWRKTDCADVVIGYRIRRQDSLIRKINGQGWTWLARLLLGIKVSDVDCSFKLVRKKVIDKIPKLQSARGGMISPELLAKANKAGFRITEVGVHHFPRTAGKQTGASLKVIIKSFADLIKLWQDLR